jgi:hypothetical protein
MIMNKITITLHGDGNNDNNKKHEYPRRILTEKERIAFAKKCVRTENQREWFTEDQYDRTYWVRAPLYQVALHVANQLRKGIVRQLANFKMDIRSSVLEACRKDIVHQMNRARVMPGTHVGIIIGSAFGQPLSQATMNSFHFAGKSATASNEIDGLREIVQIPVLPKYRTATFHFHRSNRPKSFQEAYFKARRMFVDLSLADVVENLSIEHLSKFNEPWYDAYANIYHNMPSWETWATGTLSPHAYVMRLQLRTDILHQNRIRITDIQAHLSPAFGMSTSTARSSLSGGKRKKKNATTVSMTSTSSTTADVNDNDDMTIMKDDDDLKPTVSNGDDDNNDAANNLPLLDGIKIEHFVIPGPMDSKVLDIIVTVNEPKLSSDQAANIANNYMLVTIWDKMGKIRLSSLEETNVGVSGISDVVPKIVKRTDAIESVGVKGSWFVVKASARKMLSMSLCIESIAEMFVVAGTTPPRIVNRKKLVIPITKEIPDPMKFLQRRISEEESLSLRYWQEHGKEREPSLLEQCVLEFEIHTEGSNLPQLFAHPDIDYRTCFSNEPVQIMQVLGIIGARNYLVHAQIELIRAQGGDLVDIRHILLQADGCTWNGGFLRSTYAGTAARLGGGMSSGSYGFNPGLFIVNDAVARRQQSTTRFIANAISYACESNSHVFQCEDPKRVREIRLAKKQLVEQFINPPKPKDRFAALKKTWNVIVSKAAATTETKAVVAVVADGLVDNDDDDGDDMDTVMAYYANDE